MKSESMAQLNEGYSRNFLGSNKPLKLPVLNTSQKKDLVKYDKNKYVLDYIHYSVVMSKMRRFAYYTAVNIDGTQWRDNPRSGTWKTDTRINEQFGDELYDAKKSDFDRGHLVKREDPEWGDSILAKEAGKNTFRYPNCVPQHRRLNQEIWEELENNILHKGAIGKKLKVSVFTGPVLSENDGIFVTKVGGNEVKIPNLFWKIVTWVKSDGKVYAVGFVQSQEKFLTEGALKKAADEDIFEHLKFRDGKTYQVRIEEIESLTGLKFDWPNVIRPYTKTEPSVIMVKKPEMMETYRPPRKGDIQRRMKLSLDGLKLG
jgi:endonuclease G